MEIVCYKCQELFGWLDFEQNWHTGDWAYLLFSWTWRSKRRSKQTLAWYWESSSCHKHWQNVCWTKILIFRIVSLLVHEYEFERKENKWSHFNSSSFNPNSDSTSASYQSDTGLSPPLILSVLQHFFCFVSFSKTLSVPQTRPYQFPQCIWSSVTTAACKHGDLLRFFSWKMTLQYPLQNAIPPLLEMADQEML